MVFSDSKRNFITTVSLLFFISKFRNLRPAVAEVMGDQLRLSVSCEDSLFVALHPEKALAGGKIGKVPYLLAYEILQGVRYLVIDLIVLYLILLRVHHRSRVVKAAYCVRSVFCIHERFTEGIPKGQLFPAQLLCHV